MISAEVEYFDLSKPCRIGAAMDDIRVGTHVLPSPEKASMPDSKSARVQMAPYLVPFVGYVLILDVSGSTDLIDDARVIEQIERYPAHYYDISVEDPAGGQIPKRIVLRTNWDGSGTYPCLSKSVLELLHEKYGVLLLGLDTPSLDPPGSNVLGSIAHDKGIQCLLNLTFLADWESLDKLRFSESLMIYAPPVSWTGSNAMPARALILRKP